MQGFSRTYFNLNWSLDYQRLMDTNFENYGIRLCYKKISKMKWKIKSSEPLLNINIVLALKKFMKFFSNHFNGNSHKNELAPKIALVSCKTKFDCWNKERWKTSFTNKYNKKCLLKRLSKFQRLFNPLNPKLCLEDREISTWLLKAICSAKSPGIK